ncbi:MAG: SPFH domain-containing protein [Phycisphaerales bacterium JB040]
MSDTPPSNQPPGEPPEDQNGVPERGGDAGQAPGTLPSESGRATSVRFRADADVRESARAAMRMDAANQSLADALKITFRLVQIGMVVLVVLFLGSAVRMVQEGERGIRVVLGKVQNGDLGQGLAWAPPYPIGEIVTVGSGSLELRLETSEEFFPFVSSGNWNIAESDIGKQNDLNPAEDGSLITADLNIAHSQWTVNYRRADHVEYATNVIPAQERDIVRVAAMRGVVHAVARTSIDNLLKDRDTVASVARRVAQEALDEMNSGITIEQMTLNRKFAPAVLLDNFAEVQSAAQEAGGLREQARTEAQDMMNRVAGRAAPVLVDLIDRYERAVELGEAEEAERTLAQIDALMIGDAIELDGEPVVAVVSGEVSQILADARNDSFRVVSEARGDLELFQANLERYEANPRLMVMREWASAMDAFFGREFVQSFYLPAGEGNTARAWISEDPDIRRALEMEQRRQEAEQADATREEQRRQARQDFDEQQGN